MRRLPLLLLPALLTGCATPAASGTAPASPTPDPPPPVVSFRACADEVPAPGTTHLHPPATTAEAGTAAAASGTVAGPPKTLRLQHAVTLHLPTGGLFGASGAEAVWASGQESTRGFAVADSAVDLDVTLVVSEREGVDQIAWLELSADDAEVARWETVPALSIVTDGGDGGFWSASVPTALGEEDPGTDGLGASFDAYLAAAAPPDGEYESCLVRASDGVEDGVVFSTGIGDGVYPTYVGRDAAGRVVSVLNDGGAPWGTAGVTGTPPPDYLPPDHLPPDHLPPDHLPLDDGTTQP